jgi:iron(III) transport system substrate-binding protein
MVIANTTRARLGAALLAAGLAATACGGSPTSSGGTQAAQGPTEAEKVYADLLKIPASKRHAALVKQANEEGAITIYTSMTSEVTDEVIGAFEDTYDDLDVSVYRADSETVLQRVLQEQKAGFYGNDVVESNATEMIALEQEGLMSPYRGPARQAVSDLAQFDTWTGVRFNLFAPSWNTNLVKPGEQPTSWQDLADPKWDGKLSMELEDYDWYGTLHDYFVSQGMTEQEADQVFQRMADGAKVVKGHTVQGELLSAGQFPLVASNYSYITETLKRDGAPVDYKPMVEPVIARPNGIGLMKTAEHPAAAILFTDWMLTDGQKVMADLGLTPSVERMDPFGNADVVPVNTDKLASQGDEWSKEYEQVVQQGTEIETED